MKTKRTLVSAALLLSMLLSPFGSAASAQAVTTVVTDSELVYDPLAEAASIAYEQHEDGYTVSLDRTEKSVASTTRLPRT